MILIKSIFNCVGATLLISSLPMLATIMSIAFKLRIIQRWFFFKQRLTEKWFDYIRFELLFKKYLIMETKIQTNSREKFIASAENLFSNEIHNLIHAFSSCVYLNQNTNALNGNHILYIIIWIQKLLTLPFTCIFHSVIFQKDKMIKKNCYIKTMVSMKHPTDIQFSNHIHSSQKKTL